MDNQLQVQGWPGTYSGPTSNNTPSHLTPAQSSSAPQPEPAGHYAAGKQPAILHTAAHQDRHRAVAVASVEGKDCNMPAGAEEDTHRGGMGVHGRLRGFVKGVCRRVETGRRVDGSVERRGCCS